MLAVANKKTAKLHLPVPYVEADAMQLSFADKSFDAVTIAFGLRNLSNFEEGLKELRRVLKPGGTLAVLEFSAPLVPGFKAVFNFYFRRILPRIGGMVSGSRRSVRISARFRLKIPRPEKPRQNDNGRWFFRRRIPEPDRRHRRTSHRDACVKRVFVISPPKL